MKTLNVIRAWKDESYRNSLSDEELASLPQNPAGSLVDAELEMIAGGGFNDGGVMTISKTGSSGCDDCEME